MKQKKLQLIYNIAIWLLLFLLFYSFLLIKPLWKPVFLAALVGMLPFLIGGFIAYLLYPIVGKIESLGLSRTMAILLMYILFFGGIALAVYWSFPAIMRQMMLFSEQIPELANHYKGFIRDIHISTSRWPDGMQEQVEGRVDDFETWLSGFVEKVIGTLKGVINFALVLTVIPFISFYMLKDMDLVNRAVWYMTPAKWRHPGKEFLSAVNVSLGGYIRGQLLVCLIMGVVSSLLFWAIGLDYPILLGVIIALTNVIPFFGPFLGAIPVVALALLTSVKLAILSVIIIFVLQFLEGNVLSPYIVGKSISIHPLFIIGSLMIGSEVGGIIGMLVAVPLLAVLKVAAVHSRDYLVHARQS